mgnify:CR=1 FL=1
MGTTSKVASKIESEGGMQLLSAIIEKILAEPGMMAKEVLRRKKKPALPPLARKAKLSREVYEKYAKHFASCECLCSTKGNPEERCGLPASSIGRGLSEKCHNQFKAKKEAVRKADGAEAALDFDHFLQESGELFPPKFQPNSFTDAHAHWEAQRKQSA